ncbi:MAG: type III secretion system effector protein [Simkaniaceae bacterium]|nr:type III secretion system effector protein [Simkaniaceae bacterium]
MSTLDFVPFRNHLNISCSGITPEFTAHLVALLTRIEANSEGKRLLDKIATFSVPIIIKSGEIANVYGDYIEDSSDKKTYTRLSIVWNPMEEEYFDIGKGAKGIPSPPHVGFFHELVHIYRLLVGQHTGTRCSHCDPLIWTSDEEYETITGDLTCATKKTACFSENAFRKAEGLPLRYSHNTLRTLDSSVGVAILYRLNIMSAGDVFSEIPSQSLFPRGSRWIGVTTGVDQNEIGFCEVGAGKAALLDKAAGDRCYSYVEPEDVRSEYFANFTRIGPTEENMPLAITYVRMGIDEIAELKKAHSK